MGILSINRDTFDNNQYHIVQFILLTIIIKTTVVLGSMPVFLGWYGINKAPVLIETRPQEALLINEWAKLVLDQL